eukprot:scaffold83948_cov63-Attheya_sp.AAC.6
MTERLCRQHFKFGILSDWVLQDCICVILEAKTKVINVSFGELLNYGQQMLLHHPEPRDVHSILWGLRYGAGQVPRDSLALKIVIDIDSLELDTEAAGSLQQAWSLLPDHVVKVEKFEGVENGADRFLRGSFPWGQGIEAF